MFRAQRFAAATSPRKSSSAGCQRSLRDSLHIHRHSPPTDRAWTQLSLGAKGDDNRPTHDGLMLNSVLHRNGDRCTVSGDGAPKARRQRGTDRDRVRAEHVASCDVELAIHDLHAARDVAIRAADVQVHRRVGDDHGRTISAPRPDGQRSVDERQVRAAACATGKQRGGSGISANRGRGSVTRHVSPVALRCSTVYDRSPPRMRKPTPPKLSKPNRSTRRHDLESKL